LQESISQLKIKYPSVNYRALQVDLSSQASVRAAAEEVISWPIAQIDLMINNAGIMNIPTLTLSPENHELHFATNHVGHFLLTNLLLPKLIAASQASSKGATRIINVSSSSMRDGGIRFSDINFTKPQSQLPVEEQHIVESIRMANGTFDPDVDTYTPTGAYTQSKAAVVLFCVELNRRLYAKHGITSVSLHPGVIFTELTRAFTQERLDRVKGFVEQGYLKTKNQEQGASTTLVAALDPKLGLLEGKSGDEQEGWVEFLEDCQVAQAETPEFAKGDRFARKLWTLTEELVGEKFDW
jgi:NAD(P)-dependent dehydrogenase (short-subunit alcohol dehydrogenase family)